MTRQRARAILAITAATATALALAGCSGSAAPEGTASGDAASAEGFPVTIHHAFGETTIDAAPERIATWGWGATDAVLALGEVPVAVSSMDYGGGDNKLTPWIEEAITGLDGEEPVLLDSSANEVSVEEVLATDPDVFLAPYSGLTQEEYDELTDAGVPVIAYPETAWSTPWQDVITIVGEAMGKSAEAEQVLADLDTLVADTAAEHPEFAEATIAYIDDDVDTFYMYLPSDPRVVILEQLGFTTPDSVTALDTGEGTFYTTVSYENLDQIDADVILTQAEQQSALDEFLASDRGQLIPAVKKGAVAAVVGEVVGEENVSATTPTALSLPWLLPTLADDGRDGTLLHRGDQLTAIRRQEFIERRLLLGLREDDIGVVDRVDALPGERYEQTREDGLQDIPDQEGDETGAQGRPEQRLVAEGVLPDGGAEVVQRKVEPRQPERVDDHTAGEKRDEHAQELTVPRSTGEPAHHDRGCDEADDVSAARQGEQTARLALREDRQSDDAEHQVEGHRQRTAQRAECGADKQDSEGLTCQRDGPERDDDLGRECDQRGAGHDEGRVGGQSEGARAIGNEHIGKNTTSGGGCGESHEAPRGRTPGRCGWRCDLY
ncbi:hypothetical protein GCM10009777_23500 [Microbacterium pumilum]|uniref:Fe/B12 periplasmic-binding domain-containing protein n=1 Tax=Microbacterium pumilum TaxID=344165 RepID=A0ABP5E195_9MICO